MSQERKDREGPGITGAVREPGAPETPTSRLLHERSPRSFRAVFGELLSRSRTLDTAILRIRLGAVDLSARETSGLERLRILVAEVNARTVEEEAYGLRVDGSKKENLSRIIALLEQGRLELRSAPLGGWSPDFSVFSGKGGPEAVLMGLHWFKRPFPHRGPAWAALFGPQEARLAHSRFTELWEGAHDIGPAILRLLERSSGGENANLPASAGPGRGREGAKHVDTLSGPF